jgi:hypothetical protein
MKTSKKLLAAFNESINRGKNEEVGSMDFFEVNKKTYSVIKTEQNKYALFCEDEFLPILEKVLND